MLKLMNTLLRGSFAEMEEVVFDATSIRLLEQQIREAATSLERARRDLACAMAHQSSERRAVAALTARITELEISGTAALRDGAEVLAGEVAAVIAATEDEKRDRSDAMHRFDADILRLRQVSDEGRRRLVDLRRGLELARAQEALNRAGASGRRAVASGAGALRDAEGTLARIRERHAGSREVDAALDALDSETESRGLDERLAKVGYGARPATSAQSILERMRRHAASPTYPKAGG